ncbi:MAG: ArnT family glycosyltransferase [Gammaproteobacteria bacterium]
MMRGLPRSGRLAGWPGQAWWVLAALTVLAVVTRFPLPIDETRYLAVAWEMWSRDSFLVPYLNGEPYSHKPPLLFWLFHAGWSVFGVNDWWPRLVPGLAALVLLTTVRGMAVLLWPAHPLVAGQAPLLLAGSAFFLAFSGFIMFDVLLAALVALAAAFTWRMGEGRSPWLSSLLAGAFTGLAILTKGPVALVFVVPLWLTGPWWRRDPRARGVRWWGQVLLAFVVAAAVPLAWALPAAAAGGEAYAQAILLKQTSERMVRSFAHQRPFWYYAVFLPLLWLPWVLWPRAWRALGLVAGVRDAAARFLWVWLGLPLLLLSAVSGKQPQYLLPVMPAVALLLARGFVLGDSARGEDRTGWLVGAVLVAFGALMVAGSLGFGPPAPAGEPFRAWHKGWLAEVPVIAGLAVALSGLAMPWVFGRHWVAAQARLQAFTAAFIAIVLFALLHSAAGKTFNLQPIADRVAALQSAGRTVAFWGDYHGQLGFTGRLPQPLPELMGPSAPQALQSLAAAQADALVLLEGRGPPPPGAEVFSYRRKWWALVPVDRAVTILGVTAAPVADDEQ